MIIFLYGQDTYRLRQKLREIIAHYQKIHQNSLNLKIYHAGELNFKDFKNEFQQISIFKEKKLIVLENVFLNQKFKEEFLKERDFLAKSDEIMVFFQEGSVPEKDKLAVFLKKNGKSQKFELLGNQKLKSWLKREFEKEGVEIRQGVLEKLIDFVGNDLWRASNEIKKLTNYKKAGPVEIKDINLLVKPKIETDIFKTIEAISQKNKKKALKFVEEHLEKGDSPFYLLSMINYQFRNLIIVKTGGQYNSGIHPWAAKKAANLAKFFSQEELKKIYQKIFEADLRIKTGKINPEEGIRMLIAEI